MIVSPDIQGQIDGSVAKHILAHLPLGLPVDLLPISWFPNFAFKPPYQSVLGSGKWILFDFMELHAEHPEYDKFWAWVNDNPPILTFRRELDKASVSPVVKPIEWPCYLPIPPLSERSQFDSRPLEVLNFWGYSNAQRPKLHGDIFREGMSKYGLSVTDQWDMPIRGDKNWATIYTPHWHRKPMSEVMEQMEMAKITVAMPGNGRKTFRHTECVGTLMALQHDSLAWSYPWDDSNSIGLTSEMDFFSLLEATKRTDLYDLYCACDANMRKYEAETYVRGYVLPIIQSVL